MFGKAKVHKVKEAAFPPAGVAEIILCVFDEKQKLKYHFRSARSGGGNLGSFSVLNNPNTAFEHAFLREAISARKPVSVSFREGSLRTTYFYILPYEYRKGSFHNACLQVVERSDSEEEPVAAEVALRHSRVCLLLADSGKTILSASAAVPEVFGYSSEKLVGLNLADLFSAADLGTIYSCLPDTNESLRNCTFLALDGSKRDVDVKKYTVTNECFLYVVSDITRPQLNEEIASVAARERRRIGQDLHDSIGQLLTGISLLGRSLSNSLKRVGNEAYEDAAQISDLADDANNQIRQISRGLMPVDIVHRGLHASLRDLARMTTESCGLQCDAAIDDRITFSDGAVETHLFRIAQEAVNNAVRHSGGSHICITISEENGLPQLEIQDNGHWRTIIEDEGGIGMKTMQYRASAINGQLKIKSVSGGGTCVICRLEADDSGETRMV